MKTRFRPVVSQSTVQSQLNRAHFHPNRLQWLLAVICCAAVWIPVALLAHAQLLRSTPANKADLTKAPTQVDLWFNELLEAGFNSLAVFPSNQLQATSRTNLVAGTLKIDPTNATHVIARLKPLGPGSYTVEWRVLSRDGHSAPGRLTFQVLAPQ